MKKILLVTLATLVSCSAILAQGYDWRDHRHSVSVTAGTPSLLSGASGFFTGLFSSSEDTQTKVYGTYGIHYGYNALKWLRVGGDFMYSGWRQTKVNENVDNLTLYNEVILMGKVDFTYLNRKYVRLYSGVGIGANLGIQNAHLYDNRLTPPSEDKQTFEPHFAWTITPLGLEAGGEHVYAITELNIGTAEVLRAGVGVRF